jgi:hypothetical protein
MKIVIESIFYRFDLERSFSSGNYNFKQRVTPSKEST